MLPKPKYCLQTENNVSKTGYRALFVLRNLIKSPKSRDELIDLLIKDNFLSSDVSKDTITITINTLKKVGCIISRPSKKNGNKYVLKSHPFNKILSEKNIKALCSLRDNISTLSDFYLLIYLNNLLFKIAHLAPNIELQNQILYKHALNKIDFRILNELIIYSELKKTTNICYYSPENGKENLDFNPEYFTFENGKLYIWGYCEKFNDISFLRVDRIKKVNLVTFAGKNELCENCSTKEETITYKLKGYSYRMYLENKNEKIIAENNNDEYPITIECSTNNKFNFFQRILSYGTDCVIVSPIHIKQEYKKILKEIKREYLNE